MGPPPVDDQALAGDVAGVGGGQEGDDPGDVLGQADPAERVHGEPPLGALNADYAAFQRLYADLDRDDRAPRHQMFGWPELVQNPMQLKCQLAASGTYVGDAKGYRHPRAAV